MLLITVFSVPLSLARGHLLKNRVAIWKEETPPYVIQREAALKMFVKFPEFISKITFGRTCFPGNSHFSQQLWITSSAKGFQIIVT